MSLLSSQIDNENIDKLIPHDSEIEVMLIGSVLVNSSAMQDVGYIGPDDFYIERHGWIWAAFQAVIDKGVDLDIMTTLSELQSKGIANEAGGLPYLMSLITRVPSALHIESYAAMVKENATRRRLIHAGQSIAQLAGGIPKTPIEDVIIQAEQNLIGVIEDHASAVDKTVTARIAAVSLTDRLLKAAAYPGGMGIKCGLKPLDDELGGFEAGLFYLFAGRSGMGKSSAICQVAEGIAAQDKAVLIFSLEMTAEAVLLRMACQSARVNSDMARRGLLNKSDNEALHLQLDRISKLPIEIESSGSLSVPTMRAMARRRERRGNLGAVFVDTLNAVPGHGEEYERLTSVAVGMGAWALNASYALIGAVQINRENTRTADKRPALWNLQGSSALEQKPDVVIGIHRPYYYDQSDETQKHIAYMLLLKNRYGLSDSDIKLYYDAEWPGFATLASKNVNLNDKRYIPGRHDSKDDLP